jgi:hypothetical protein
MFTPDTLQETIDRITKMEFYFDTVQKALEINPDFLQKEAPAGMMLQELTEYYESGQWLADFEADEAGLLPSDLKRGVLSEDGVYNLLFEISESPEEI